jgi:predicted amino acid-binding ACT domain protein
MTVTAIDLFNILKIKIGEGEAKALVEYIEMQAKIKIEEQMTAYATKTDLKEEVHKLELKIEKVRSDLIKWMFIFWIGQVSVSIALIMLLFK